MEIKNISPRAFHAVEVAFDLGRAHEEGVFVTLRDKAPVFRYDLIGVVFKIVGYKKVVENGVDYSRIMVVGGDGEDINWQNDSECDDPEFWIRAEYFRMVKAVAPKQLVELFLF